MCIFSKGRSENARGAGHDYWLRHHGPDPDPDTNANADPDANGAGPDSSGAYPDARDTVYVRMIHRIILRIFRQGWSRYPSGAGHNYSHNTGYDASGTDHDHHASVADPNPDASGAYPDNPYNIKGR